MTSQLRGATEDSKLASIRHHDPVTLAFAEALRATFPETIRSIILFGSRARGDARKDSDYDFIVLLDKLDATAKDKVRDIEVAMLNRHEALVSALVMRPADWERRAALPIGRNVAREGVPV
jgi:predicted nucleotidyltransferase